MAIIVYRPWATEGLEGLKLYQVANEVEERAVLFEILDEFMEGWGDDPDDSPLVTEPKRVQEPMVRLHATEEERAKAEVTYAAELERFAKEEKLYKEGLAWHKKKYTKIKTSTLWAWLNSEHFVGEDRAARVVKHEPQESVRK